MCVCVHIYMCVYIHIYVSMCLIDAYICVYVFDRCILFWNDLRINFMIKIMVILMIKRMIIATDSLIADSV